MPIFRSCQGCDDHQIAATWHYSREKRLYHWCAAKKEFLYENGEPLIDKTTIPPPPMPSDCELCLKDRGKTEWELNPLSQKWFHWCNTMHAFRDANGHCDFQDMWEEPDRSPSHPYSAKSRPCNNCTLRDYEPNWQYDQKENMYFHWCDSFKKVWENGSQQDVTPASYIPTSQRPDFIWRNNRSQRNDNCAWVTLSRLLINQNAEIMDTASTYKELANVGITPANMDRPAVPEDILPTAEQFGEIEKIIFTDGGSQGVPASELPSRGVPLRKEFATSVRIKNSSVGHVVVGYWAPCTPKSPGDSTHWFRFMDYQAYDPGKDVTNWVMEQDKLIKYVYWFVQDLQ